MLSLLVLGLFTLSVVFALGKLFELYRAHFKVGSKAWNVYQIALREDLARFSGRTASAEEAHDFELKEQAYIRRLERQLEQNRFPDEIERRRAQAYRVRRRLEAAQAYETLKRD